MDEKCKACQCTTCTNDKAGECISGEGECKFESSCPKPVTGCPKYSFGENHYAILLNQRDKLLTAAKAAVENCEWCEEGVIEYENGYLPTGMVRHEQKACPLCAKARVALAEAGEPVPTEVYDVDFVKSLLNTQAAIKAAEGKEGEDATRSSDKT